MKVLEVKNLTLRFGGLVALSDVSFDLKQGEILAVIGPNGAGKTSLFNVVTGLYPATAGSIKFLGKPLQSIPTLFQKFAAVLGVLLFAVFCVLSLNIQELWGVSIVSRYNYQEEFDYIGAFKEALTYIFSMEWRWTILPLVISFVFGILALRKFEQAASFTPMVAARAGLARTFQNLRLMGSASVAENIRTVINRRPKPGIFASMLQLPSLYRYERNIEAEVQEILLQLGLDSYSHKRADSLAYGLQRRVEIARAVATKPKVLLLDEPAAGLNPSESQELLSLVKEISNSGITVLLIEHDMSVVMALSDRIIVLCYGEKIAEGVPDEVRSNPDVIKAYLGTAAEI